MGILAALVIAAGQIVAPLSAVLVLVGTRLSRTPWREIGSVRPKSWVGSLVVGIALGIPFKFLMKAIMMPLLGANLINQAHHYLVGNRAALPAAVWAMIVVAGFGKETVFRRYMFERFGKLLGRSLSATGISCKRRNIAILRSFRQSQVGPSRDLPLERALSCKKSREGRTSMRSRGCLCPKRMPG